MENVAKHHYERGEVKDIGFTVSFLIFGVCYLMNAVDRPFAVPDEARYVEIALEMARSGDFITPYLNDIKYFEKPPLFYWIQAIIFQVLPINGFSGRLGLGLFSLATLFVVYKGMWRLTKEVRVSWQSMIILGTSLFFFAMGHLVTLDMGFTCCVTLSLMAFIVGHYTDPDTENSQRQRRRWIWLSASGAALAVLAKGLAGLALPCIVIAVWLTMAGRWSKLFPLYLPSSLGIFFLLVLPWHLAVAYKNPEFAWFYFIQEHFLRYTTSVHRRSGPWWMGISSLLLGLTPWGWIFLHRGVLFVKGILCSSSENLTKYKIDKKGSLSLFFLIWTVCIVGFFSISDSKLVPYFLPALPGAAMFTALQLKNDDQQCSHHFTDFLGQGILFVILGASCLAVHVLGAQTHWYKAYVFIVLGVIFYLCAASYFLFLKRTLPYNEVFRLTSFIGLLLCLAVYWIGPLFQRPDSRKLVEIVKNIDPDRVYQYATYIYDFPLYLGKTTPLIEWKGEMAYGLDYHTQPTTPYRTVKSVFQEIEQGKLSTCLVMKAYALDYLASKPSDFKKVVPPYGVICYNLQHQRDGSDVHK